MGWTKTNLQGKEVLIDDYIVSICDDIKKRVSSGWDCVFIIDGAERSGKSTLAITIGTYLDQTLSANNIISGGDDIVTKIREAKDGSVLIIDEGSLVLSTRGGMDSSQRQLLNILNVIGQKHLTIIIVLPCFFDLTKDVAIRRSKFLIHLTPDRDLKRGSGCVYGEHSKKVLYVEGKKKYNSYWVQDFDYKIHFNDFVPEWFAEYKAIKNKSMEETLNPDKKQTTNLDITRKIRMKQAEKNKEIALKLLSEGFSQTKVAEIMNLSRKTIQIYKEGGGNCED